MGCSSLDGPSSAAAAASVAAVVVVSNEAAAAVATTAAVCIVAAVAFAAEAVAAVERLLKEFVFLFCHRVDVSLSHVRTHTTTRVVAT